MIGRCFNAQKACVWPACDELARTDVVACCKPCTPASLLALACMHSCRSSQLSPSANRLSKRSMHSITASLPWLLVTKEQQSRIEKLPA